MPARAFLTSVATTVAALTLAACGGGGEQPIRIALLNPCHGAWGAGYEAYIGAIELPLIERGATLAGKKPSDGLVGAEVAGRKVELLVGCLAEDGDSFSSPRELLEVRRLVEREHADIVLGVGGPVTVAERDYAKRRPDATFIIGYGALQSASLRDPAPNFFTLLPELTMISGGLGAYAYNTLGWRRAVTIDADINQGWATTAGFVASFCALGGKVVERIWTPVANGAADTKAVLAQVPKQGVGGIYWGAPDIFVLLELGRSLPLLQGNVGRRIVGHWFNSIVVPEFHEAFGKRLDGLSIDPGHAALDPTNEAFVRYSERYTKAFPDQPAFFGVAGGQSVYAPMEAALRALERVDGDLSDGGERFRAALAATDFQSPIGHIRLDRERRPIGPVFVRTHRWNPKIRAIEGAELHTYPDVDQTFGGYFTPDMPPPSRTSPPCKKLANPPAWMKVGRR